MNILAIDTSTEIEVITIKTDKTLVDKTTESGLRHSATIINNIDSALKEASISLKDIDLIGVGLGPGSFTGIRIAVTTARMFAQLLDIPLVGFSTHQIYAASVETENSEEQVMVAFDAKKQRVFGALYNGGKNYPEEITPPGDYYMEELLEKLDSGQMIHLIGNGTEKYKEIIDGKTSNSKYYENFIPSGEKACSVVENLYKENPEKYGDYKLVVPHYSRKSDAEVAKEKREESKK